MSQIRFPKEINPELPGIICISHGPFACALTETAEMIVGELENIAALGLEPEDSLEDYTNRMKDMVQAFPDGSIILVDLFGGTPSNTLVKAVCGTGWEKEVFAVSGMNLPMILEIVHNREFMKGKELVRQACMGYESGAVDIGKCITEMMEE